MGTSLRKNDIVQITIPWRLHTSVLNVFTNYSNHGRLSYEGFKTILLSAVNSYNLSHNYLYNLFNQIKEDKDYLDFEQFLLAIEKLAQRIDKNSDKIFNELLNKVSNFYKHLPNSEHLDFSNLKYNITNNSHIIDIINKPTPRHSLDLITNYQSINIGVKYNTITPPPRESPPQREFFPHPVMGVEGSSDKDGGDDKGEGPDARDGGGAQEPRFLQGTLKSEQVEVATSARPFESFEDKFTDKLNRLDTLFNNTQLLKLDFDKVNQNYKSLKSSEKEWEEKIKKLEEEKTSLREMIDSLIADKKCLSNKIEDLKKEMTDMESKLLNKNDEIENLKHSNTNLVTLEEELWLESYEETSLFLIFTYYRKLDHDSGNWIIDEESLVNFVYDYGLVEEHNEGDDKILRAKLAFDKCINSNLTHDSTKNLTLLSFKLFLAEYGKMAFKENDSNKALKLVIEKVIAENNMPITQDQIHDNHEHGDNDSQYATSMTVEGNLWFQ